MGFSEICLYKTVINSYVNRFAPPEITDVDFSIQWLYDEAEKQWARWLPAEVSNNIRYGGYYTTLAKPGLRIVSMNMNYCYTFNYWTYYKSQDPASMLLWLNQVLEAAEKAGEKVLRKSIRINFLVQNNSANGSLINNFTVGSYP